MGSSTIAFAEIMVSADNVQLRLLIQKRKPLSCFQYCGLLYGVQQPFSIAAPMQTPSCVSLHQHCWLWLLCLHSCSRFVSTRVTVSRSFCMVHPKSVEVPAMQSAWFAAQSLRNTASLYKSQLQQQQQQLLKLPSDKALSHDKVRISLSVRVAITATHQIL